MEQKGKSWLEVSLQYGATSRNVGLSILFISEFEERGVRKVTTLQSIETQPFDRVICLVS